MACTNCNEQTIPTIPLNQGCPGCGSGCTDYPCANGVIDTTCIVYTGPNLTCIGATTNTCLELILQKIDAQVCVTIGDYSGFNLGCLRDDYAISTAQQFAESISNYVCTLRADFETFTTVTFVDYQTAVDERFDDIETPGFASCASVGIGPTDTLLEVLVKLAGVECNILAQLADISTANWSQCFTVLVPPTTIVGALNVLLDQICQINTGSAALPTFNNLGSCLPTPGATDTLVDTINKIKTRLCLSPTFSAANLNTNNCVQFSGVNTLEEVIDAQNSLLDEISEDSIRGASSDFVITLIDPLQPCLGRTIALNPAIVDRLVALNGADVTPGTLVDKIVAGTNVTLDFGIINPGQLTISATGGTPLDEEVKATALDPTPGYLDAKLIGDANSAITISVTPTVTNDQIQISPSVDLEALINLIFDEIEDNETLRDRFCAIVANCPSPCDAPSGISVEYV